MRPLPSYWTFDRFIRELDNEYLQKVMQRVVLQAAGLGIIDTSFISLDSTPIVANTCQNNPKSSVKNKFSKDNHPKSDKDCKLGVHTASNQYNERKFEYYWGYKNHVLVDCITGLPIYETTTTADVADSTVVEDVLSQTNDFLSIDECTLIADKGYDIRAVYNLVKDVYHGDCVITLNKRNTKNLRNCQADTRYAKPRLLCTRTADSLIETELVRSIAALSNVQNQAVVPVTIKTGTMAKRIAAVRNMLLFLMIIDSPLTVNVFLSRKFMHFVPSLNAITPALNQQVRNASGYMASMPQEI